LSRTLIKWIVFLLIFSNSNSLPLGAQSNVFSPVAVPQAPISMLTGHWDTNRRSWNNLEFVLTPANVTGGHFGLLTTLPIIGDAWTQPLFVPGVVTSSGQQDLIIVATAENRVYAYDANRFTSVWTNVIGNSIASYPGSSGSEGYYQGHLGCIATPAVDVVAQKLYLLCGDATSPSWQIRILSLTTGTLLNTIVVSGTVVGGGNPGGGDDLSGSNVVLNSFLANGRSSITLANGNVYVAFAGMPEDNGVYHGWVVGYSTTSLSQIGIWCSTPNGYGGGVWMAGGGPAVDASGNLYVATGNGTYDGTTNYGESVVKLSPTLAVVDWFTPANYAALNGSDADLSSGRVMLLPGGQLEIAGKDFSVYNVSTSCMGHLQGSSGCPLQNFTTTGNNIYGGSSGSYGGAFGLNTLYLPITGGPIYAFTYSGTTFNTTPTISGTNFSFPGASAMTISSMGAFNGILWFVATTAGGAFGSIRSGVLYAYNPVTLSEYWNSTNVVGDALGSMAKYVSPLVADGKIFVTTNSGYVAVYGMGAH
jgi:hypothetical protein